ncbi:MAG: serine hydrolase domain-containing protein [Aquihabitans sp.]
MNPLSTIDQWDVPHASAAIVDRNGSMVTNGDISRIFALASVTKMLFAYSSLVAVEEGTLALDDPAGPPGCTVRHLLAHAGGFGFDTGVLMPPQRKRVYSNTGFEALADHLASRAGMPAQTYLTEAVLVPLGMTSTDIGDRSLAHGAFSNVDDLTRFAAELLQPTLIAPSTMAEATTVQFPGLEGILPGFGTQTPNDWGLGFEIRGHKSPHWTGTMNAPSTFGHFGGAGTFLWVDPTRDRSLVVLTDRPFGDWAVTAWPPLADAVAEDSDRGQ